MPNQWQMQLIRRLQTQEDRRLAAENRRIAASGLNETEPAVVNALGNVARGFIARRQQEQLQRSLEQDAEGQAALKQRNMAFNQAMALYRSGAPVPPNLAQQAGMEHLAKLSPKLQNVRYERNRLTGKLVAFSNGQPVSEYDMGSMPYASQLSKSTSVDPFMRTQIDLVRRSVVKPVSQLNMATGRPETRYIVDDGAALELFNDPDIAPEIKRMLLPWAQRALRKGTKKGPAVPSITELAQPSGKGQAGEEEGIDY